MTVDPALDAVLSRCLAHKPEDRYRDASELLTELTRWRPGQSAPSSPATSSSDKEAKSIFGRRSPSDPDAAMRMIRDAMAASRKPGGLMSAADLLEEAINKAPELRDKYESQLKLWRRGICM